MPRERIPVHLISDDGDKSISDLSSMLFRLGYEATSSQAEILSKCPQLPADQKVFLLSLTVPGFLQEQGQDVLCRLKKSQVLGVVHNHSTTSDYQHWDVCDDFVYWPCSIDELSFRLKRICNTELYSTPGTTVQELNDYLIGMNMIGKSPRFLKAIEIIKRIAGHDVAVLIEGETGTGKELAARAIHDLSSRRDCPFIPMNCGAVPDNLVENELFGHKKGAYTDAICEQKGILSQVNNGTLFLDEVDTFSPKAQVVLLRFIEDQYYRPLGAENNRQANIRIVAASNKELSVQVDKGLFRSDLFHRLNVMRIEMPPLSQRPEDIELLADYFLSRFKLHYNMRKKYLHPDSIKWLKRRNWPGNIRELENLLHRELLLSQGECIQIKQKAYSIKDRRINTLDRRQKHILHESFSEAKKNVIHHFEKTYLTHLYHVSNGNVTLAAKRAGKERRALGKLLKKHGISINQ